MVRSGVGRHDRDAQVCGALGVRAEVEAAMILKYLLRARVIQSRLQHMSERAVPASRKCRKQPIFFWGFVSVGNEINSVRIRHKNTKLAILIKWFSMFS